MIRKMITPDHCRELFHVLLRKDFGRRHQSRLPVVLRAHNHGEERKNCFAGTYVALQQAVHDIRT